MKAAADSRPEPAKAQHYEILHREQRFLSAAKTKGDVTIKGDVSKKNILKKIYTHEPLIIGY